MTTNNHPANGPVSLDRLHQISEILSKAAAQSDGGNLGYAMADAVKVIDSAIASFGAEPVPCPKCNDTGMADSGGVQPWGEPILIECDCRAAMLQAGNFRETPDSSTSNCREISETSTNGHEIETHTLLKSIEGMEVSVDVSTCDADAGHRYFGTVTEISELETAKNGFILLVQDAKPNFKQAGNSPATGFDPASGPDHSVEVRYFAPPGYVLVPKEMTDDIGEAIAMRANCCGGIALDIYDAMIAASQREG
ncbi:hypothetical protein [Citrobacter werkmanii]|uniref:hypothetical protein n=1 Tax=Citrobacter werkmanii TaxID=67827 RepID=UPI001F25F889|nr:hypothetical protein [Citrobacter werkmanii]